jgi:CHAT domain-containing protein
VFLVPDGALNLVSFPALPTGVGTYLVETGPVFHLLSTERDLIETSDAPVGSGLLAVGGAAYDLPQSAARGGVVRSGDCRTTGKLQFEDLPGTRAEIQDIARLWATRAGASVTTSTGDVTMLSGRAASKGAVSRASVGRRVLHFATHGFFLGGPCTAAPGTTRGVGGVASSTRVRAVADSPLLVSGLAFAGANRPAARGRQADGILTAEEVAGLNLQGTEWAVLSACDTGLGEIHPNEGVFGLRRAFQIAGVRTIIMSLWSVEDVSTRAWMRALYAARFEEHLSTADSVHRADTRTLQDRRRRGQSTHPFYWAAFVAAGDWR